MMCKPFAVSVAALVTLPYSVLAQPGSGVVYKSLDEGVSVNSTTTYWTPERLRNAKPLRLPKPTSINVEATANQTIGTPTRGSGSPPTVNLAPDTQGQLFTPDRKVNSVNDDAVEPEKVGSAGAYFTSSRLIPLSADTVYPYRAVGKLFFTIPGEGDFICSASVLRPRVVLTAGHCVHKGSGGSSGFYTNFLFVPAYRNGNAPFRRWSPTFVATTPTWATGNDNVPNAADYAMFEMSDQSVGKIGSVTGYFGYRTQGLIPNHSTLLGYPANLDSGEIMHQVTAQSFQRASSNTATYGSDMTGGSSGGPWVENFGALAAGQGGGKNSGLNQVVGVTSYGPVSTSPLYQGSSILDSRFTDLLNTICKHRSGNC